MLNHPRFKPHLRVDVVPGEGVFVLSGAQQTLLKGTLYERVVPHVGQGLSPEQVCDRLEGRLSAAEVFFVLAQLEKKGYLCEESTTLPADEAALWWSQDVDPAEASRRLASTTVSLRGLGVETAALADLLDSSRVRLGEGGVFEIVVADGYLRDELRDVNAEALHTGRPWILAKPVGREVWVGPLFVPGETGCWACLAERLRANRPVESYLSTRDGRSGGLPPITDRAGSTATLGVAWGLIAHAAASWAGRGDLATLRGQIRTFDLVTWEAKSHTVVRLPYCPACGGGRESEPAPARPITLDSRPKGFTRDGGHRVVAPEVTLERYSHHVSPITGAVSMLERIGAEVGGDGLQHTYIAGHNLARRHRDLHHLRSDLRNMSSGKGASDVQARASGLCEGLERYSGVFRGDEPRRTVRLAELGDSAIHPHDLLLFSDRQYRDRDDWNARESRYNFVPVPFDPSAPIEWTPAWSLTRGEARHLPTSFCYYGYPQKGVEPFCVADSNGNAAGNTREEAILQGFLELVERDSVALWWYNRVRRPGVDLEGFGEPYLARLRDSLRARGREVWGLDLTSDLGIPVFAVLSREPDAAAERIILGFGAHLDPQVALLRAATEMNQMMAWLGEAAVAGRAEAIDDPETVHWLRTATVANQPYLAPDGSPPRTAASFAKDWAEDVTEDVRSCQALVEKRGMELIVLDQTRPEIGLPVVKVVVPGLRHFWARFAPGRLYDVPARLGWVSSRVAEEDLNPIPMFL